MALDRDALIQFISNAPTPQTKRDIARAFNVKGGPDRIELKQLLKTLEDTGVIAKQTGGAYSMPEGLPAVATIEVTEIDVDGDVFARAVDVPEALQHIRIEVKPQKKGHPALGEGDRALAALKKRDENLYEARVLRSLDDVRNQVVGLVGQHKNTWVLQPADKKAREDYEIPQADLNGAKEDDMVVAQIQPARGQKKKKVRVVEIIGNATDRRAISLLSLHEVGLRDHFPDEVIKETDGMKVPPIKGREDLRNIPLITIDGADARDFDDAVFAEETDEGFHLIVAIADVSYYVRPGSPLDREAYLRGNSTYFPDRVVPMLPEALSNDLCSLRPDEDRACLAVHMWINGDGKLLRYKFVRALMRSHARTIYEDVQALKDGTSDKHENMRPEIENLYKAFGVLEKARERRGALDLELPERQILIDEDGDMTGVRPRGRVDAHKLIEEFMVLANVAAASALEDKRAPCVYRIHDQPKADRLHNAGEFINGFGLSLPKGQNIQPKKLNHLLNQASGLPYRHLIHVVILRTQSQACYSPENIGHYGLALSKYAHFTSPIRRYADLLVHRSLVRAYDLGPGGLSDSEEARLAEISQSISTSERKSIEAERNATDRFTSSYLSEKVGEEFTGQISGVTGFGLFVSLADTGADGIVPSRSMKNDYYVHDEERHALIGRRTGTLFRLGAEVKVRLMEADGLTGSLVFELAPESRRGADISGFQESKYVKKPSSGAPQHKKRTGKKALNKSAKKNIRKRSKKK